MNSSVTGCLDMLHTTRLSHCRSEVTGYWLHRRSLDCLADIFRGHEPEGEQILLSLYLQVLLANLKSNIFKSMQ